MRERRYNATEELKMGKPRIAGTRPTTALVWITAKPASQLPDLKKGMEGGRESDLTGQQLGKKKSVHCSYQQHPSPLNIPHPRIHCTQQHQHLLELFTLRPPRGHNNQEHAFSPCSHAISEHTLTPLHLHFHLSIVYTSFLDVPGTTNIQLFMHHQNIIIQFIMNPQSILPIPLHSSLPQTAAHSNHSTCSIESGSASWQPFVRRQATLKPNQALEW